MTQEAKCFNTPILYPTVDKLDINKLINVSSSLNNLKTKADELDDDKLKTVSETRRN